MTEYPKVSVITPTHERPQMLNRCIEMFLAQDYEGEMEMLILDTSAHHYYVMELPHHKNIHIWHMPKKMRIGEMRNFLCEKATGEIIIDFDDDDLYSHNWITKNVWFLGSSKAMVTGLSRVYYYHAEKKEVRMNAGRPNRIAGHTLCFYKKHWKRVKFKDYHIGEDTQFCKDSERMVVPHEFNKDFLAIIHKGNTASSRIFNTFEKHDTKQVISSLQSEIQNRLLYL